MTTPNATLIANQTALLNTIIASRANVSAFFQAQIDLTSNLGNKWTNFKTAAATVATSINNHMTMCQGNIDFAWKDQIMADSQARANQYFAAMEADGDALASYLASMPFDPALGAQLLSKVLAHFDQLTNELGTYLGWVIATIPDPTALAARIAADRAAAGL